MTVLDASAVLALLFAEDGGRVVEEALAADSQRALLGAANWAEVAGKVTHTSRAGRTRPGRVGPRTDARERT